MTRLRSLKPTVFKSSRVLANFPVPRNTGTHVSRPRTLAIRIRSLSRSYSASTSPLFYKEPTVDRVTSLLQSASDIPKEKFKNFVPAANDIGGYMTLTLDSISQAAVERAISTSNCSSSSETESNDQTNDSV